MTPAPSRPEGSAPVLELAIVTYVAVSCLDLPRAWRDSPIERFGWVALLVWTLPVLVSLLRGDKAREPAPRTGLMCWAVFLAFVGTIGSLNVLEHWGLACAVAALMPASRMSWIWWLTAVTWMPLFGWLVKGVPLGAIPLLRIGGALVGSFLALNSKGRTRTTWESIHAGSGVSSPVL